jgi:hypothetical protein
VIPSHPVSIREKIREKVNHNVDASRRVQPIELYADAFVKLKGAQDNAGFDLLLFKR